jgi:hypothetical protein
MSGYDEGRVSYSEQVRRRQRCVRAGAEWRVVQRGVVCRGFPVVDAANRCPCDVRVGLPPRQGLQAPEKQHASEQDFMEFIRKYQEGEIFPYREQLRKNTGFCPSLLP